MTENALFSAATRPLDLVVLVLPHCSILEVASVLDPLRAANRHLGRDAFRFRIVTPDGQPAPLTCGIELPSSGALAAAKGADLLMVIAGYRLAEVATRPLIRDLRRMAPLCAAIGGVDAAPWVLARAGLLDGHRATVHWEDLEDLAHAHPHVTVSPDRFVIDRNRLTAAGAAPAYDLMLHLIRARHGAGLARQVAQSFLQPPRPGHTAQITATAGPSPPEPGYDPRVARVLARMEATLDSPEPVSALAARVGLSARRLESLFRDNLGTTPGAHALSLRLAAARRMLTDTAHPLSEIALRCGFSSPATLSRAFRRAFACAPASLRRQRD
ncbi:GlxA family transcriptional regulator [Pseudotabrizicola algicola]|uniref:GlxA family transcriptional regulator n=1 Tax=Pseudotabrizicola algicola TaxID=2709381 RepID=A0A6B3RVL0_9RHOB|nr:GlxA family transcriptional regulator [Pseudotabrizicola algicola]NEX46999.1 GlxA family transcriptional regulator [Pseudotabrizicola algicola]